MASLAAIRQGLAANLSAAYAPEFQVSAYMLANPTNPTIWVRPSPSEGITYHQAFDDGLENWVIMVQAFVGTVSDIGAQKKLDELIESTGVKAALETDKTLGGAAQTITVQSCMQYQEYARPDGSSVLGADWTVLVYPNGG